MARNQSIHGLRGLAVLAVFVYHVHRSIVTGGFDSAIREGGGTYQLLEAGRLGVELFFMISGYLITASLLRHQSGKRFLLNRVVRIYPAFLLPHLLIFAAGPLIGYAWMADLSAGEYLLHFLSNLLLLPGVFDLPIAQIVAWSLSYEFAFYLFAASAWWCANFRGPAIVRWSLWAAWTALIGLMLWRHPRAWFFVAGAAAHWTSGMLSGGAQRLLIVIGLPALVLVPLLFDRLFPLAIACGFVAFVAVAAQRGPLARSLRSPPLQFLGEISYSFYLWHPLVLFVTKRAFGFGGLVKDPLADALLFVLLSGLASLAAGYLSWRVVERPLAERWSRRTVPVGGELRAMRQWHAELNRYLAADSRGAKRDLRLPAVDSRPSSCARIPLEGTAQGVRMETVEQHRAAPSAREAASAQVVGCQQSDEEEHCRERHRGFGPTEIGIETGDAGEDTPEEATALCGDRP